jgi:PadR family transcriptional regulator PadR
MSGVPELAILRLLQDREMYGYEIVESLRQRSGAVIAPGEGVVYPILHALEKDGALRARRQPVDGRTRVYYTLTSKGVRRLFDQTDQWQRVAGAVAALLAGGAHVA